MISNFKCKKKKKKYSYFIWSRCCWRGSRTPWFWQLCEEEESFYMVQAMIIRTSC